MFNTECVRQWSFVSVPARPGNLARPGLLARIGIDETTVVFACASAGLAASTVIVLRALSQAF